MKNVLVLLAAFSGTAFLNAAPPSRLHQAINSNETFILEGHRRSLPNSVQDLGAASSYFALPQLALHFQMSTSQAADLKRLIALQRDRSSSWYHKWLTPEQFGARYGVNENDLKKVKEWLESAGFTNVEMSRSRMFLRLSGTVSDVDNLFGVSIHQYRRSGKSFYANAANPVFPKALHGMVSGLTGLTSFRARPFVRRQTLPQITIGIPGNHFLGPDDLATIYNLHTLYNQGTDGTGETIAVVGQSNIALSDIEAFQTAVGLPIKDPEVIRAGFDPGISPDDESEADLDLEWTGAVARGATILYVNSSNALDSAVYAIENNLASIISISYGLCEAAAGSAAMAVYNTAYQEANAQGITVVVASGDTGAAACDVDQDSTGTPETTASQGLAVSFPASSPYVTAVGGTEFDEAQGSFWDSSGHAISYVPEIAWNDTSTFKALSGSGGGASSQFTKPDWQSGTGVPADGFRDVPDVAFSASPVHDAYLICSAGSCSNGFAPPLNQIYFVGGTSCAAPVFSGILAILNQSSQGRQGNVNPALYALASFSSGVFHDVELGDNRVPCMAGTAGCAKGYLGFAARPGYDQVTGLGSVDATQLIEQWGADFQLAPTPTSLNLASGGTGSANIQVTRFANFAGSVSFTCAVSDSLTNTTCSVSGPVNGSGTAALTVANTSTAAALTHRFWAVPPPGPFLFLAIASVTGLLFWAATRRRWMPVGFAGLCLLTAASCGVQPSSGGSTSTKTLTGNITVTATSGVLQHSVTVPVTITIS